MATILVLALLAIAGGGVVYVLMRGERTWLDDPAAEPLPQPAVPATQAPEPIEEPSADPEPTDAFVLAPRSDPLPEPGAQPSTGRVTRGRRRPRFEDVADLTTPDPADLGIEAAAVQAAPVPEKVPVHIPFTTRLFGAVRLALLVAVTAAAVALAVVGAAYLLIERVLGGR